MLANFNEVCFKIYCHWLQLPARVNKVWHFLGVGMKGPRVQNFLVIANVILTDALTFMLK